MRRAWLILIWVIGAVLWVSRASAQLPEFHPSPYIYRLKVAGCPYQPQQQVLTGFRIQGKAGIVTALHGVANCATINAISGDSDDVFDNLSIRFVDVEEDVAIVSSADLDKLPTDGLGAIDNLSLVPSTQWKELSVIGYPDQLDEQRPTVITQMIEERSLAGLVPDKYKDSVKNRNSPSLEATVLSVEANLVPGLSGAPMLTPDGNVVGVVNGGLEKGDIGISWAMPWDKIKWLSVEQAQTKLIALGASDPQEALSFSSTYPKNESEEITVMPVTETSMNAFRSREQTRITFVAGGQPIEIVQAMSYNGVRGERSIEITSNKLNDLLGEPTKVINKLGAYWIGANNYYLQAPILDSDNKVTEYCRKIKQPITDFDDLFQFHSQLLTTKIEESTGFKGVYLSDETVNGVPTRHYLVEIPPISRLGFPASVQSMVGDVWLAKQGGYIVRFVGESPVWNASNQLTGTLHQVIDFYDVGKDVKIDLPAACTKTQPATQPTPTSPASSPGVVPSGAIRQVWVEHNAVQAGQQGMRIHVDFTVNNALGIESYIGAYFWYVSGEILKGENRNYMAPNGQLVTSGKFTPDDESVHYPDYTLFMPYDELVLPSGQYDL